jgi:hypothetical protein
VGKQTKRDVPLADDSDKLDGPWTREQCVEELRRIAELDPAKFISRNYFRNHAKIKERVWNLHFGTFQEFKRGADIVLSRHAHRMELDVAKHSSVSAFRDMNDQKSGYEGKYLRPASRRFQTLLHITDIHDKDCDPFWRRVMMETAQRAQPEKIIIGGDLFDLPEFGNYTVDPREWDVVGRIRWVHEFLADMRAVCPDAEVVLTAGNHEARLLRHLAEETPAMRAVLADLHGFTVPKLLGLDTYEVNYISRDDLGTFTKKDLTEEIKKNYYIAWDCYLAHHFPEGEKMGYPGANGHHHRHWARQHYSPVFGAFSWMQLGCGHRRQASYCAGEAWGMGFLLAHVDTHRKHVVHDYIQVRDFAMVGGRFYERGDEEV